MNKNVQEILENRKRILTEHINLDKKCQKDPFLSQFMEGRVESEESWLEETEKLISSDFQPKELVEILSNRWAILKTYITDAAGYQGTDDRKVRGRNAINTHWFEETESLIKFVRSEL